MKRIAIEQVLHRSELAKADSYFTYFFSLLLVAEALAKSMVLGIVASISDEKDRHRYRLEHQLVKADGLGDWGRVIEDALIGPASQFLLVEARIEQTALTQMCKQGTWQYDAVMALTEVSTSLGIKVEEVPVKSSMLRWFRLLTTLRNKTRAHGATKPASTGIVAELMMKSIMLIYENFCLFQRPWAYLYRNLSGKYRVSLIAGDEGMFSYLKSRQDEQLLNGIYLFIGGPRKLNLIESDPELQDFYFSNGGLNNKNYELLSYYTDDRICGDASAYLVPPSKLPGSDTDGYSELQVRGNCFSNVPDLYADYVKRNTLETELKSLLLDDKRPIVTLLGTGLIYSKA